jgi:hypothetical protein
MVPNWGPQSYCGLIVLPLHSSGGFSKTQTYHAAQQAESNQTL